MEFLTLMAAYGFMFILLLAAMLFKDRKLKYRLRMAGYWYMIFFTIAQILTEDDLWIKIYSGFISIAWIWLADSEFRSEQYYQRQMAKLKNATDMLKLAAGELEKFKQKKIEKLFYDRRN